MKRSTRGTPGRFLIPVLLTLTGCSSVRPSGYLTDYAAMERVKGVDLDLVRSIDHARLDAYPVLVMGDVALSDKVSKEIEFSDKYGKFLQRRIEKELIASRKFKIVTADKRFLEFGKYDLRPARLDLAITDIEYGSGILRYLIGWDSLGATIVQVEGRLADPQTGQILLEFADCRRNSGEPGLGFNILGIKRLFKPSYLVSVSLHRMSADIAKLLASLKSAPPMSAQPKNGT